MTKSDERGTIRLKPPARTVNSGSESVYPDGLIFVKEIVGCIFGLGLVANAALFAIQAFQIVRSRNATGVSTFTFAGFCLLQITGILHGFFQGDLYLLFGMAASFLACGTVTVLSLVYRNRTSNLSEVARP